MQTLFIAIYFCVAGNCAAGWVNQPFTDEATCTAYSQVYSMELQARAPESQGEIICVTEQELRQAMQQFNIIEMQRLEDLPPITN